MHRGTQSRHADKTNMVRPALALFAGLALWLPLQFQSRIDVVAIYPSVRDGNNRLVTNLTKEDFQGQVDGKAVQLTTFSVESVPLSIVLLLDMSGSMTPVFLQIRESARHFVRGLSQRDRMRIGTFGVEVSLSPLMTSDQSILDRILSEELWPDGSTPMWRALEAGLKSLAAEPPRRVIVILTDGEAFNDDRKDAVESLTERTETTVYAIGLPGSGLAGPVRSLARESGGGHLVLRADEQLRTAFETLLQELRAQYVVGFTPPTLDGRTHSLRVRTRSNGLTVRAPSRIFLGDRR